MKITAVRLNINFNQWIIFFFIEQYRILHIDLLLRCSIPYKVMRRWTYAWFVSLVLTKKSILTLNFIFNITIKYVLELKPTIASLCLTYLKQLSKQDIFLQGWYSILYESLIEGNIFGIVFECLYILFVIGV